MSREVGIWFLLYTAGCIYSIEIMANHQMFDTLPFSNVNEIQRVDTNINHYNGNSILSTHNDILADIDPDLNNLFPNDFKNQCKNCDT